MQRGTGKRGEVCGEKEQAQRFGQEAHGERPDTKADGRETRGRRRRARRRKRGRRKRVLRARQRSGGRSQIERARAERLAGFASPRSGRCRHRAFATDRGARMVPTLPDACWAGRTTRGGRRKRMEPATRRCRHEISARTQRRGAEGPHWLRSAQSPLRDAGRRGSKQPARKDREAASCGEGTGSGSKTRGGEAKMTDVPFRHGRDGSQSRKRKRGAARDENTDVDSGRWGQRAARERRRQRGNGASGPARRRVERKA